LPKLVPSHYAQNMRIPNLTELPDVAQRREWARLLGCDYTTLVRAEERGDIRGYRPTNRSVVYTKETILSWVLPGLVKGK